MRLFGEEDIGLPVIECRATASERVGGRCAVDVYTPLVQEEPHDRPPEAAVLRWVNVDGPLAVEGTRGAIAAHIAAQC